jgi:hypothetical protein
MTAGAAVAVVCCLGCMAFQAVATACAWAAWVNRKELYIAKVRDLV